MLFSCGRCLLLSHATPLIGARLSGPHWLPALSFHLLLFGATLAGRGQRHDCRRRAIATRALGWGLLGRPVVVVDDVVVLKRLVQSQVPCSDSIRALAPGCSQVVSCVRIQVPIRSSNSSVCGRLGSSGSRPAGMR